MDTEKESLESSQPTEETSGASASETPIPPTPAPVLESESAVPESQAQPQDPPSDISEEAPLETAEQEPPEETKEPEVSTDHLKWVLEALLFTSQKPLSPKELRDVLQKAAGEEQAEDRVRVFKKIPARLLEQSLEELAAEIEQSGRSYRLMCVAGAWQFVCRPAYAPWLRTFHGIKPRPSRLSQPALETLAIIAYRQPITRAEIEQIRGVAVDAVVNTLKERGLIVEAGRAEVVGRPMQYTTSQAFLEYFGLASLDDMPAADELRRLPVERPPALVTAEAAPAPEETAAEETKAEEVKPEETQAAEPDSEIRE